MRSEVGFTIALLALGLCGCASPAPLPATPLFAGLKGQDSEDPEATQLLRQRIAERFPIGTSEAGLADYLSSQGMKPREARSYTAGEVGVCRSPILVTWRADQAGQVTELFVGYSDTACL